MNGQSTDKQVGSGLSGGAILGAQYDAQRGYQRTQAIQIALQAGNGAPRGVTGLIADAELILAWLDNKPAA